MPHDLAVVHSPSPSFSTLSFSVTFTPGATARFGLLGGLLLYLVTASKLRVAEVRELTMTLRGRLAR